MKYRIIERKSHILREKELEELYEEGWELIGCHNNDGECAYYYYFKQHGKD